MVVTSCHSQNYQQKVSFTLFLWGPGSSLWRWCLTDLVTATFATINNLAGAHLSLSKSFILIERKDVVGGKIGSTLWLTKPGPPRAGMTASRAQRPAVTLGQWTQRAGYFTRSIQQQRFRFQIMVRDQESLVVLLLEKKAEAGRKEKKGRREGKSNGRKKRKRAGWWKGEREEGRTVRGRDGGREERMEKGGRVEGRMKEVREGGRDRTKRRGQKVTETLWFVLDP